MARYRILDEPAPSTLSTWAVKPMWPLFAIMFAGAWLAFPWFAFNAFAIGSMGRYRQLAWAAGAFAGAGLLTALLALLAGAGVLAKGAVPYALTVVIFWKLLCGYLLYAGQDPSFELHQYAGGRARNGVFVVLVGAFFLRRLVGEWILRTFADPPLLRAIAAQVLL